MTEDRPQQLLSVIPVRSDADEVRLWDLWRDFVARRRLVALVVVASLLAAAVYLVVTPAVYEAETFLLPPLPQQALIKSKEGELFPRVEEGLTGLPVTDVARAYSSFIRALDSRTLRREFFDRENLAAVYLGDDAPDPRASYLAFEQRFNAGLIVTRPDGSDVARLRFEFPDAAEAARLLNDFVIFVAERSRAEILGTVDFELGARKVRLRKQLAEQRSLIHATTKDQIVRLEEAANIASAMGLYEQSAAMFAVRNDRDNEQQSVQIPLYLHGEKALRSEIEALRGRESVDPFIPELRVLESRLNSLERFEIDREAFRVYRLDQSAVTPQAPIRPRRALVLLGALVAGFVLATLVVLIGGSIARQRAAQEPVPG